MLRELAEQDIISFVKNVYEFIMQWHKFQSKGECGGFIKGRDATVYAGNGLYDDAAITIWTRGSTAEVIWKTQAKHRGKLSLL